MGESAMDEWGNGVLSNLANETLCTNQEFIPLQCAKKKDYYGRKGFLEVGDLCSPTSIPWIFILMWVAYKSSYDVGEGLRKDPIIQLHPTTANNSGGQTTESLRNHSNSKENRITIPLSLHFSHTKRFFHFYFERKLFNNFNKETKFIHE